MDESGVIVMKNVCGWCGRVKEFGDGKEGEETSHGLCLVCALGLRMEAKDLGGGQLSHEERDALLNFNYREALK